LLTAHHGAHSFAKSPKGVMLPVAASYFNTLRGFTVMIGALTTRGRHGTLRVSF